MTNEEYNAASVYTNERRQNQLERSELQAVLLQQQKLASQQQQTPMDVTSASTSAPPLVVTMAPIFDSLRNGSEAEMVPQTKPNNSLASPPANPTNNDLLRVPSTNHSIPSHSSFQKSPSTQSITPSPSIAQQQDSHPPPVQHPPQHPPPMQHKQQYSDPPSPPYHLLFDLSQMKQGELTNAIIHLYRGEMSRLIAYRQRLDTCTNWAVTTTAAMTVFALGNQNIPHYFHSIILVFVLIFLNLESRRHGYYVAVKARVRQIECGFYGRVLLGDTFGRSICGLIPYAEPMQQQQQEMEQTSDDEQHHSAPAISASPAAPQFVSPFIQARNDNSSTTSNGGVSNNDLEALHARLVGVEIHQGTDMEDDAAAQSHMEKSIQATTKHFGDQEGDKTQPTTLPPQQQQQQQSQKPEKRKNLRHKSHFLISPYANDWTHLLYHSLLYPEITITLFDSILIRLRRVYLALLVGVLASWIIKVNLDVGLENRWWLVTIVSGLYVCIVFVVVYYLPRKRQRMHAEKHVTAMFMQERKKQIKAEANKVVDSNEEMANAATQVEMTNRQEGLRKRNASNGPTHPPTAANGHQQAATRHPPPHQQQQQQTQLHQQHQRSASDHPFLQYSSGAPQQQSQWQPAYTPPLPSSRSHPHPFSQYLPTLHPRPSFDDLRYWNKHASRYQLEYDDDL